MKLEVRRVIPASADELFEAWMDADGMSQWMRPGPTKDARVTLDPRIGGKFTIDMIGETKTYSHWGEFTLVDRPRKLEFTWCAEWFPNGSSVTVEFVPHAGGTEVVLTHDGLPDQESVDSHGQGWGDILEHLGKYQEMRI